MTATTEASTTRFQAFIASLRSDATRVTYESGIRKILGPDPDAFLALDPGRAKDVLVDYVIKNRERLTGATIASRLANVKAFCDEYGYNLEWKIIRRKIPPVRYVGVDRAPTVEEVRKALEGADLRLAFIMLAMASGGFRVGAWDWLKVRDLSPRDSGAASLTIYRGEPEEYVAFISPEAVEAWKRYRESRERVGEKVDAGSPLVRDKWEYGSRWDKERIAPDLAHPLAGEAVKHLLERGWIKAGLRERKVKSEFKAAHGFRKFCKTQLSKAGLSWEDQEVLLGHRMAYYKPTLEHMEEEYLKAVPFLTLSEAEEAKRELTKEKEENEKKWKDYRLENLELKDVVRELKEDKDAMKAEYDARLSRLEEQMRSALGAPPEATPVPQSRPRAETSGS
ncbi:MAG: site-specific integrase [Thaumarchaeota archaeon]|nr:site-specific integrase [Nitrososphaerota archaeon]